ncbi:MAG: hypothetical protein ACYDA6_10415, partial [Solirubrobacteraceae bacterium]
MAEQEVHEHVRALAARNVSAEDEVSFLGAGFYDNYVPAFIDILCERSELLTPYTPYQPEVSQGSLQIMFEYQTAISELTALPVANASVYEGPSAVASAAYMAHLHTGRRRIVVSAALHPHTRETLATYARGFGADIVEVPLAAGRGVTDIDAWRAAIDADTAAAVFAQPNFYGVVEDAPALCAAAKGTIDADGSAGGAAPPSAGSSAGSVPLVIAQVDPITLGLLKPPGECGVDVAVGEGQALGGRLDFGGPSFGFFAARQELLRRMPGRIAGETVDLDGRRGFVLTLQTREQHIRRERATSNICTAQALNALAGLLHLVWLGRAGFVELGRLLLARTQYARKRLLELDGVSELHGGAVVRELALHVDCEVAAVRRRCAAEGVNPGADIFALTKHPADRGGLLVALSERRTRADIDRLVEVLGRALGEERAGSGGAHRAPLSRGGAHAADSAAPSQPESAVPA